MSELQSELEKIQEKIIKHYDEINKLRIESSRLQKEEAEKSVLFQTKVIQDLVRIFKIDTSKLEYFSDSGMMFFIKNYNMRIDIDIISESFVIDYEPILNFDGDVDPEGDTVELDLFKITAKDVLDSMREMLNKRYNQLKQEIKQIDKNVSEIYDLGETWENEEYKE